MKRHAYRMGWVAAVAAMTTIACTCGLLSGLGQARDSLQTAQAFASQAQGLATELEGSGIAATAQALATAAGSSGLAETAQAIATSGSFSFGEAPPDIPVIDDHENFFGSPEIVSYLTKVKFKSALDFYKKEMLARDWKEAQDSVVSGDSAVLYYQKADRRATVTISRSGNQTVVQVLIETK